VAATVWVKVVVMEALKVTAGANKVVGAAPVRVAETLAEVGARVGALRVVTMVTAKVEMTVAIKARVAA